MEKSLYECSFYLKDEKGNKTTEYLTTYFETEYSHHAENLLIATFANGDRSRIFFTSPQTVRDKETLLKKEMVYVLFQFQLGDENGKTLKTTFNYMFTDIIMARNWHKAEMLLDAKYGQGNPKRILNRTSRTYRYDELRNIPSNYETYEFTFYLKNEKGNKASEMMTMSVDDNSYFKAEEKLIAMLANGNRDRVWHATGRTIGLALPSLLREQYEEEQKQERIRKEKEREEERKRKAIEREEKEKEWKRKLEEQRKEREAAYQASLSTKSSPKKKPDADTAPVVQTSVQQKQSEKEKEEYEAWLKESEEELAREQALKKANAKKAKEGESSNPRVHPVVNILVFFISFLCLLSVFAITGIIKDERIWFLSAVIVPILLIVLRDKRGWGAWKPAKISVMILITALIIDFVMSRIA